MSEYKFEVGDRVKITKHNVLYDPVHTISKVVWEDLSYMYYLDDYETPYFGCELISVTDGSSTVLQEKEPDLVNSPPHYKLDGLDIESVEIIKSILGKYFKWWALGNSLKYILRAEKKDGLRDYKKLVKNMGWVIEEMEDEE